MLAIAATIVLPGIPATPICHKLKVVSCSLPTSLA